MSDQFLTIGIVKIPYRTENINDENYQVPKGISRFEDKSGPGWYARLQRNKKIIINKKVYDGKCNPKESLDKIINIYKKELNSLEKKGIVSKRTRIRKTVKTAMVGVTFFWSAYKKSNSQFTAYQLNISINYRPGPKKTKYRNKSIYCCTSQQFSEKRVKERLRLAYAHREHFEKLDSENRANELKNGFPSDHLLLELYGHIKYEDIQYDQLVKKFNAFMRESKI